MFLTVLDHPWQAEPPFYASSVANQNAQDNEAATQHLKLPIQTITFERNQKALSLKPSFLASIV